MLYELLFWVTSYIWDYLINLALIACYFFLAMENSRESAIKCVATALVSNIFIQYITVTYFRKSSSNISSF